MFVTVQHGSANLSVEFTEPKASLLRKAVAVEVRESGGKALTPGTYELCVVHGANVGEVVTDDNITSLCDGDTLAVKPGKKTSAAMSIQGFWRSRGTQQARAES
eukprot:TRINITY_DN43095_c0_g1_i1.p2 TRINITY_DN43095_c0_g1~~TRINITY_DN43095_c0_g1_i1.p2  ORF type:complete len:104 (+),score=18.52 TRINITY_DN43095_c0_g1_i1:55-366(+)